MEDHRTRRATSAARRRLLDRCRQIQYGRITGLVLRNGEPHFAPDTRIIRTIAFNGTANSAGCAARNDFELKRAWLEAFAHFDAIGSGTIAEIDLRAGLPFRMTLEEKDPP